MRGTLPEVTLPRLFNRALTSFEHRPMVKKVRAYFAEALGNPKGPLTVSAADLSAAQGGLRIERLDAAQRAEQPLQMSKLREPDLLDEAIPREAATKLQDAEFDEEMAQVRAQHHREKSASVKRMSGGKLAGIFSAVWAIPTAVAALLPVILSPNISLAHLMMGRALFDYPVAKTIAAFSNGLPALILGGITLGLVMLLRSRGKQLPTDETFTSNNGTTYRPVELLGKGSQGRVYRATAAGSRKIVAIKVLDSNFQSFPGVENPRQQLLKEFALQVRMGTPSPDPGQAHICKALDFGYTEGGNPFIVMEYIAGRNLHAIIGKNAKEGIFIPVEEAVDIICQAAEGLRFAHSLKITHRDVKPGNIMLERKGRRQKPFVKALDFGIGKCFEDGATATQVMKGTPGFLDYPLSAKYQTLDDDNSTPQERMDLLVKIDSTALLITLYALLTNRLPFKPGQPRNPSAKLPPHPNIPQALYQVMERGITGSEEIRYADYAVLIKSLRDAVSVPVYPFKSEPNPPSLPPRPAGKARATAAAALAAAPTAAVINDGDFETKVWGPATTVLGKNLMSVEVEQLMQELHQAQELRPLLEKVAADAQARITELNQQIAKLDVEVIRLGIGEQVSIQIAPKLSVEQAVQEVLNEFELAGLSFDAKTLTRLMKQNAHISRLIRDLRARVKEREEHLIKLQKCITTSEGQTIVERSSPRSRF